MTNNSEPPADNMERIVCNLTGMVRNEKMEGRDYLVVPMIMMVEGVLNGSNGPLYYPAEELQTCPQVWNHKPVVVYHPSLNGKALSACEKDTIDVHKIGIIMNTTFDGKRLKAEAWLETNRVEEVDKRVLEAIENNTMMEVSTGLFTQNELTEGEFNGKKYTAIARNYRPDHLAILPDQTGACSIEDGAGLLRVNAKNKQELNDTLAMLGLNLNEMSHDDIREALYEALPKSKTEDGMICEGPWIAEIYDSYLIYHKGEKLYKQAYTVKDDKATLEGVPEEVERKVTYEPVNNSLIDNHFGGKTMDKEAFVGELIANGKWSEDDREWLMGLEEDRLQKLGSVENKDESESTEDDTKSEDADASKSDDSEQTQNAVDPDVLKDMAQVYAERKGELIATITANEKNTFSKEKLESMEINDLKAISAIAKKEEVADDVAAPAPTSNYAGQAPVSNATASDKKEEPLATPTMNFGSEE